MGRIPRHASSGTRCLAPLLSSAQTTRRSLTPPPHVRLHGPHSSEIHLMGKIIFRKIQRGKFKFQLTLEDMRGCCIEQPMVPVSMHDYRAILPHRRSSNDFDTWAVTFYILLINCLLSSFFTCAGWNKINQFSHSLPLTVQFFLKKLFYTSSACHRAYRHWWNFPVIKRLRASRTISATNSTWIYLFRRSNFQITSDSLREFSVVIIIEGQSNMKENFNMKIIFRLWSWSEWFFGWFLGELNFLVDFKSKFKKFQVSKEFYGLF